MLRLQLLATVVAAFGCVAPARAQSAALTDAPPVSLPSHTDGNSPFFWFGGRLHAFTSIGWPQRLSRADSLFAAWETERVDTRDFRNRTVWVESALVDEEAVVCAWYHHEPGGMYEDNLLTAPKIGAAVSFDGGATLLDLGIILESGDEPDPAARNGFFTGGHGDFTVVADRDRQFLYFFFTNYGGARESQGVCVARLAYADRHAPRGKVRKFYRGAWNEPGLGGACTPIFPVTRDWSHPDPEAFWGPAVHWNTHLGRWVMLLNSAGGEPGWSQQGIYIAYAADLANPAAWSAPALLLPRSAIPSWSTFYPQVCGLEEGGTDSVAGETARFFLHGTSAWEIRFSRPPDPIPPSDPAGETPPAATPPPRTTPKPVERSTPDR